MSSAALMIAGAWTGFLGTRGSLMLDVVVLAMAAVLPLLAVSIWLAKRGRYALHKRLQISLAVVLLVAVTLFEVDMRTGPGWAALSTGTVVAKPSADVYYALYIHLIFAITTPLVWIWTIGRALIKFDDPPVRNAYSPAHKFWAWLATLDMAATAITGWVFYYLAFVR